MYMLSCCLRYLIINLCLGIFVIKKIIVKICKIRLQSLNYKLNETNLSCHTKNMLCINIQIQVLFITFHVWHLIYKPFICIHFSFHFSFSLHDSNLPISFFRYKISCFYDTIFTFLTQSNFYGPVSFFLYFFIEIEFFTTQLNKLNTFYGTVNEYKKIEWRMIN